MSKKEIEKVCSWVEEGTDGDCECRFCKASRLIELSDRLFKIPLMYGVDQGDYEMLRSVAVEICPEVIDYEPHTDEAEVEKARTRYQLLQKVDTYVLGMDNDQLSVLAKTLEDYNQ